MTEALIVGLMAAVPATVAAIGAWVCKKRTDVIVLKAAEIHNTTNGAYQAVKAELVEARKEIAALKALWEQT